MYAWISSDGKVVNYNSYRREVATCCWLFADYLLFGHALSASCHQSEYPESQRPFGFILEIGNNKKILAIGPIALGVFLGIECMLWGSVLNSFVAYFLNSYYSADLINYPTVKQIKDILPTFCVSIAVAAAMWGLSFFRLSVYLLLPLQLLLGVSLAYLVYERTALPEYLELRQVTLSLLKRKSYT